MRTARAKHPVVQPLSTPVSSVGRCYAITLVHRETHHDGTGRCDRRGKFRQIASDRSVRRNRCICAAISWAWRRASVRWLAIRSSVASDWADWLSTYLRSARQPLHPCGSNGDRLRAEHFVVRDGRFRKLEFSLEILAGDALSSALHDAGDTRGGACQRCGASAYHLATVRGQRLQRCGAVLLDGSASWRIAI